MVQDRKGKAAKSKKSLELKKYLATKDKLRGNDEYGMLTVAPIQAPSEPWVEAQFKTFVDVGPDGDEIVRTYHDARVFPPREPGKPATTTRMKRCRLCRKYTPGPAVSARGTCDDCRCMPLSKIEEEMVAAGILSSRDGGSVKLQVPTRPGRGSRGWRVRGGDGKAERANTWSTNETAHSPGRRSGS